MLTLNNKIKIPDIGTGTFGSDHASPEQVANAAAFALRCGYRLFDCASVYNNEAQIGSIFTKAITQGIVKREELFVTSKVWNDMHGPGDVLISMEKTLKDLNFEYIDCYFVHWPFPNYHAPGCTGDSRNPDSRPFKSDEFMSVWRQMEDLVDKGLAKTIGMSNMTVVKMEAVLPLCRIKPELIEMELHPSFQQKDLLDYCLEKKIQPVGYCPLGSPNRPERDRSPDDVVDTELPNVKAIAEARGIHPVLVCLKWVFQSGAIPIPFSLNEKNIKANLECISSDPLTIDEMSLLKQDDRNCRLIKGQVFLWEGAKSWEDLWDINGEIV